MKILNPTILLSAGISIAIGLTGCGGSDTDVAESPSVDSTVEETVEPTPTETATTPPTTESPATDGGSSTSAPEFASVALCDQTTYAEGGCTQEVTSFANTSTETVYLSADVSAMPLDSTQTCSWTYVEGDAGQNVEIGSYSLPREQGKDQLECYLQPPDTGFPVGAYSVTISSDTGGTTPITKEFSVDQ